MTARSLLYVPGDKPAMFAKACRSGADAVVCDLEDAVAMARKDDARAAVAGWLGSEECSILRRTEHVAIHVRINSGSLVRDDLAALRGAALDGIYVPKASAGAVDEAATLGIPLTALIETAAGVLDARVIASHPGVTRLAIGEADLAGETGIRPGPDGAEMMPARVQVVLASAAAGLEPPVGPVSVDFKDLESLRASTAALVRAGFGGRAAIHPAQVGVINEAFTPTTEEVEAAEKLLARFAEAGGGVCVDEHGRMVDEATVRHARRVVAQAKR